MRVPLEHIAEAPGFWILAAGINAARYEVG